MQVPRESIFNSVFAALKAITGVKSAQRRFVPISQVTADQCPFLCTAQHDQDPSFSAAKGWGQPYSWKLILLVVIYQVTTDDPSFTPMSNINPIIDAVEQMFPGTLDRLPGPGGRNVGRIGQATLAIPGIQQIQIEKVQIDDGLNTSGSIAEITLGIYGL